LYTAVQATILYPDVFFFSVITKDYCPFDNFNVTCPDGEVILMMEAMYGRMRRDGCLVSDVYIGCGNSILPEMDAKCSGRDHCVMPVMDDELLRKTRCPADMHAYLSASYACIPGEIILFHLIAHSRKPP
jgi:hypothetical protein